MPTHENLPRFNLSPDGHLGGWNLTDERGQVVRHFDNKDDVTSGGVLEEAIGGEGTVRIRRQDGRIQEERTYPRSRDPRKSPG